MPTLLWLSPDLGLSTEQLLSAITAAGMGTSLLMAAGCNNMLLALATWLLYLSLYAAGQTFLSFQWDILLLEVGWAAVMLAPLPGGRAAARCWGLASQMGRLAVPAQGGRFLSHQSSVITPQSPCRSTGSSTRAPHPTPPPRAGKLASGVARSPVPPAVLLLRWVLFKLMFMSGVVKIQAHCPTWLKLTACHYHFATQCIPTPLSW